MAKQTTEGRVGQIKDRVQLKNPATEKWVKVDTKTGRILNHKKTAGPYKGIRKQ